MSAARLPHTSTFSADTVPVLTNTRWHPSPTEAVARTVWAQSCWKPVQSVEVYESPAILAIAGGVPEELSARWEQAAAEHRGRPAP